MTENPKRPKKPFSLARVLILLAWIASLVLIAAGTWSSYAADLRNDQYQLINLGQCVHDGGRMYVDCWENKPPGIAWINALGILLTGGRQIGAWVLPGVTLVLALIVAGWALHRTLSPLTSALTVLLGSVVFTLRLYDGASINPDFYSSCLELCAGSVWLVALVAPGARGCAVAGLIAGVLFAAALTVKQTACVGLLSVTIVTLTMAVFHRPDRGRWAMSAALTWTGFALGLAVVVGVLAHRGTLTPAREAIFDFNTGLFTGSALLDAATSWIRQRDGLEPLQLGLFLALVGTVATFRGGRVNQVSRAAVFVLLLWWVGQVLLALLGPSRSMRYWQAAFPPMLWLAALGFLHIEEVFLRLRRGHRAAVAIMSLALLLLLGGPLVSHYAYGLATSYDTLVTGDAQRTRLRKIGQRLDQMVPKDDRIYAWSYDAGIYVHASRRSACRFAFPRSQDQMQEILAGLNAGKAHTILIPDGPSPYFDPWCKEACYGELLDTLGAYEPRGAVENYNLWVRRGADGRE